MLWWQPEEVYWPIYCLNTLGLVSWLLCCAESETWVNTDTVAKLAEVEQVLLLDWEGTKQEHSVVEASWLWRAEESQWVSDCSDTCDSIPGKPRHSLLELLPVNAGLTSIDYPDLICNSVPGGINRTLTEWLLVLPKWERVAGRSSDRICMPCQKSVRCALGST